MRVGFVWPWSTMHLLQSSVKATLNTHGQQLQRWSQLYHPI